MPRHILHSLLIGILCLSVRILMGQSIQVSPELNMRNDFAYFIIPWSNSCGLIRDKSYRITLQNLKEDFSWTQEKDLELKGKRWKILDAFPHGQGLGVAYLSRLEERTAFIYSLFDQYGNPLEDWVPDLGMDPDLQAEVNLISSEDKSWISAGLKDKDGNRSILIFNRFVRDSFLCKPSRTLFNFDDYYAGYAALSNRGELYLAGTERAKSRKRQQTSVKIQGINSRGIRTTDHTTLVDGKDLYEIDIAVDNAHDRLIMAGLYNEYGDSAPSGYLYENITQGGGLQLIPFDKELLKSWGFKGKDALQNQFTMSLRNLHFKEDGSLVVFFENSKELMRRPYFNNSLDPAGLGGMRWIDYYYDDIFVLSVDRNGQKQWENILRKKQFSQDDQGQFSSFFIIRNATFLRILFNDEIKNESTVSEYILLPDGRNYRKSILNTGSAGLNLRIQDAIQTGPASLWVPSESNGKMVLVRMDI